MHAGRINGVMIYEGHEVCNVSAEAAISGCQNVPSISQYTHTHTNTHTRTHPDKKNATYSVVSPESPLVKNSPVRLVSLLSLRTLFGERERERGGDDEGGAWYVCVGVRDVVTCYLFLATAGTQGEHAFTNLLHIYSRPNQVRTISHHLGTSFCAPTTSKVESAYISIYRFRTLQHSPFLYCNHIRSVFSRASGRS